MKTAYALIDYENVQPASLSMLNQEHFKIIVFVGMNQTKIAIDVASALQQMGPRAEYIRIAGNGANALDFHIAFYAGRLAALDPSASFYIVSKDTGFDPVIRHLKDKKIRAHRVPSVADITSVKVSQATSRSEKVAVVVADLRQRGTGKPGTVKTLLSTINAVFQKTLSDAELSALVHELQLQGIITVNNTKIVYTLPN